MTWIQNLACLWVLIVAPAGFVCGDIQFFERHEGESVELPCVAEPSSLPTIGIYLKRRWLKPRQVLFKYTKLSFTSDKPADRSRISVSGDPSSHSVTVNISQLTAADTDRYYCEFVDSQFPADVHKEGKTEFFLLVRAAPSSVDTELVEMCAGGSAVLPCHPPREETSAVEEVILTRQRSRAPVEVVYRSKLQHGSSNPPSVSRLPVDRLQLTSGPRPGGVAYNLTLLQLQPEDSGLYSCQLLPSGTPSRNISHGRPVIFLSVQGGLCGCSSNDQHVIVLYTLSAAVAILLFLLLIGVSICMCKKRGGSKSNPQVPIYEEMVVAQAQSRKLVAPLVEDGNASEYRNCSVKKSCPENYYESPSGSLFPRKVSAITP